MKSSDRDDREFEPVFIAANVREVESVEELFEQEGIEYNVRPEEFQRTGLTFGSSYHGLIFEVLGGQADYCRRLLSSKGLRRGIVPPPE